MVIEQQEEIGPTEACEHCGEEIASDSEACPACGELRIQQKCALHPDRDAKGQCVICGVAVCSECNQGGNSHYVCAEHCAIPIQQGWAQVYTTDDDLEAQLIRENLEAEGIDARVLSQKDHFSLPVELGDLSQVRVMVPAYSYSEAAEVISENMDDSGEVSFGDDSEDVPVA